MSKSKALSLLESYEKLTGKKIIESEEPGKKDGEGEGSEDPAKKGEEGNKDENMNNNGEQTKELISKVIESFAGDQEKTDAAVGAIKELACSEDPTAKKFMEALDDVTSSMELTKVSEDADAEAMFVFEPEKWKNLGEKYGKKA